METTMLIQMTPENLATIVEEAVKKALRIQKVNEKSDEFLTIDEAARRLNLNTDTVRKKVNEAEIEAVKTGRKWLIKSSSIDKYLKQCQRRQPKSRKQIESEASTYIFLKNQEGK